MMRSADSIESLDNASIASDTSDSSTVNLSTGKRVLPQPKLTVRTSYDFKNSQTDTSTVTQNPSGHVQA